MLYTIKCHTCQKEGTRGVFSRYLQPDGWIAVAWGSRHSEHLETVCSLECLRAFKVHEDDVPQRGAS